MCDCKWRDIATAPKDGKLFLGWVSAMRFGENDEAGRPTEHDVSDHDFCRWQHGENGYYENMMGKIGDQQDITHWMPLPEPPAKTGEPKT